MKLPTLAHRLHFGRLHTCFDPVHDLTCVLAMHSNVLGPAIGGCRCIMYDSYEAAAIDALKLAHAMSMKAAIHHLPHGGAKMVVIKPKVIHNREGFFQRIGAFVDGFQGSYITAVDSGTNESDMQSIAKTTPHVFCNAHDDHTQSPATLTAQGVLRAIEAAMLHCHKTEDLTHRTFAVQGLGNVGGAVASLLADRGARLIVTDIDAEHVRTIAKRLDAQYVAPERIYEQPCDAFVPCALGGVINPITLPKLVAKIVVGSANNIFENDERDALQAHAQGVLCIPDFVANGGGLMHASGVIRQESNHETLVRIDGIRQTTLNVLEDAAKQNRSPTEVALHLAKQRIQAASHD